MFFPLLRCRKDRVEPAFFCRKGPETNRSRMKNRYLAAPLPATAKSPGSQRTRDENDLYSFFDAGAQNPLEKSS